MAPIPKRSVMIDGRKTSVAIEGPFWTALREISRSRRATMSEVAAEIYRELPKDANFSSAIRVWIMEYYRDLAFDNSEARSAR